MRCCIPKSRPKYRHLLDPRPRVQVPQPSWTRQVFTAAASHLGSTGTFEFRIPDLTFSFCCGPPNWNRMGDQYPAFTIFATVPPSPRRRNKTQSLMFPFSYRLWLFETATSDRPRRSAIYPFIPHSTLECVNCVNRFALAFLARTRRFVASDVYAKGEPMKRRVSFGQGDVEACEQHMWMEVGPPPALCMGREGARACWGWAGPRLCGL